MEGSTAFNPSDYFMTITRRQKQPDGSFVYVDNKYLQVRDRVLWFRHDHPTGQIVTEILSEPGVEPAVVQATVTFTGLDGEQARGTGLGQCDKARWSDWLEKAETKAIGRALAMIGYGTQFALELDEEEDDPLIVDAPVESRKSRQASESTPARSNGSNGPAMTNPGAPATDNQLRFIANLGKDLKLDSSGLDMASAELFGGVLIDSLTKGQASEFIEQLKFRKAEADDSLKQEVPF